MMSADMRLIESIHKVEEEIGATNGKIKMIREERKLQVEEFPEYERLATLVEQLKLARAELKDAISNDPALSMTETELDELKFKLSDLKEILSHHLVVYFQDTGRDVVADQYDQTRQIEIKAKLGKEALDQEKLPFEQLEQEGAEVTITETRSDGSKRVIKEAKHAAA